MDGAALGIPIFLAKDGSPISVFLQCENPEIQKETKLLFEYYGGVVLKKYVGLHTILISDRAVASETDVPTFSVQWVFSCVKNRKLLDAKLFLLNEESYVDRNFVDVIYNKIETNDGTLLVTNLCFEGAMFHRETGRGKKNSPAIKHICVEVHKPDDESDFYTEQAKLIVDEAISHFLLIQNIDAAKETKFISNRNYLQSAVFNEVNFDSDSGDSFVEPPPDKSNPFKGNFKEPLLLLSTRPKKKVRSDLEIPLEMER